ncbi:hypothetical protein D1818_09540 [Aquimarina sp. BL5]|uniref:hypothetical protein n=1 Tax=Aquimarina sp. BL5 TaxID=1714860 RepID=UPI000E4C6B46|nr:hypothetical protein [Aquimarina sp. BL5]AXT51056.1 hypothetical protein D1818_09540 [Aquimarina sp. BL5]RKM90252.1 hypothetical protein D7036_24035 [Aquimarina sp. BL5]
MFSKNPVAVFKKRSEKWYQDLQNYSQESLYHKPSSDQWTLAELYDHIMRVAKTYQLPNFHKCIDNDTRNGKPKNSAAYLIFNLNITPSRNIKMESFPSKIVADFTPEILDRDILENNFKEFIAETISKESLVKKCDTKIKHSHPFFGMINAIEWFSLIEIHMRHHERQKKRLESMNK